MTHFELFGLPPSFPIDLAALEKQYRALSLQCHPDRVARDADARERRLALERTTALNDAFQVLKDPVRRAFYLLKLAGVDLDREDLGTQKDMPLEFLEEVIDRREALSEAKAAKDLTRVRALAEAVAAEQDKALALGVESLAALQGAPGDAASLKNASHQLGRVRYFTRFLEEVEQIEEGAL